MLRELLQGKLHHATVTDCRIDYPGSLTVDLDLIERSGLLVHQRIQLLNCHNGYRLETYLIAGERGKGEIIVNGAAARHAQRGDIVIIAGYALYNENEVVDHEPKVLVLGGRNEVIATYGTVSG
jgi:aspartate 1-decarboxylase